MFQRCVLHFYISTYFILTSVCIPAFGIYINPGCVSTNTMVDRLYMYLSRGTLDWTIKDKGIKLGKHQPWKPEG
jgi:hypothetical protein